MCTVSWLHHADGYELFCNRDERKARAAAWPPRVRTLHGVRFIAPIDAQHGGSWLAVNECGTAFSLLNRYDQVATLTSAPISRGLLRYDLLACVTPAQVAARLAGLPLTSFQPFTLAVVPLRLTAQVFHRNGRQWLSEDAPRLPLTSSSFDTSKVIAQRQAHFASLHNSVGTINAELLSRFHHSQGILTALRGLSAGGRLWLMACAQTSQSDSFYGGQSGHSNRRFGRRIEKRDSQRIKRGARLRRALCPACRRQFAR